MTFEQRRIQAEVNLLRAEAEVLEKALLDRVGSEPPSPMVRAEIAQVALLLAYADELEAQITGDTSYSEKMARQAFLEGFHFGVEHGFLNGPNADRPLMENCWRSSETKRGFQ